LKEKKSYKKIQKSTKNLKDATVSAAQGGRENASQKILSDVTMRYEKERKKC